MPLSPQVLFAYLNISDYMKFDIFYFIYFVFSLCVQGFRFVAPRERFLILSSLRCSLLRTQVYDASDCTRLNFYGVPKPMKHIAGGWEYQCPQQYGLVALYVDFGRHHAMTPVTKVHYGKCCKIYGKLLYTLY